MNNIVENQVLENNIIERNVLENENNNNNFGITIIRLNERQLYNNEPDVYHCPVCIENISIDTVVMTNCNHSFCCECIYKYIQTCNQDTPPRCFICRENTNSYRVTSENSMTSLKSIL